MAKNDTTVAQFFPGGGDSSFAFGIIQQGVVFQGEGGGEHGVYNFALNQGVGILE
jgi:hypothetical protein